MKRGYVTLVVALGSLMVIAAVSWHSVEEIHYLKSFFPREFSVEEAYFASKIELIKVVLISLPLILATIFSYIFLSKRTSHESASCR